MATALFAAVSAFGAWLTAREMRLDRIERNRPFVLLDFPFTASHVVYFMAKNLGSSVARNISIEFDPVPIDYKNRKLTELSIFQKPIPIMLPGTEIRQFFQVSHELFTKDVPRVFEVTVNYQGEGKSEYSQTFNIDLEQWGDITPPPKTVEENLKELVKEIENLRKTLSK